MKKLLALIIIFVLLIALAIWSPWKDWNLSLVNLIGIESTEKAASLKVRSLDGEIDIYMDGEYKDTAAATGEFTEINQIKQGEHTILLQRKGDTNNNYYKLTKKLNFEPGVDVVIGYDLGPTQTFSEGHILYTKQNFINEGNPKLDVFALPDGVKVYLDEKYLGETPLKELDLDINNQHRLRFEKDGYDTLEISILPEKQEDRNRLKNLQLYLEINLFAKPIKTVTQ